MSLGAEVIDLVADGLEVRDNGVLEIDGTVIGADGNAEGGVTHGECRIESRETNFANRKFQISARNEPGGRSALDACGLGRLDLENLQMSPLCVDFATQAFIN